VYLKRDILQTRTKQPTARHGTPGRCRHLGDFVSYYVGQETKEGFSAVGRNVAVLEDTGINILIVRFVKICQDLKSRSAGAPDPVFDGYNWFQSSDGMSAERKERKPRRNRSRSRQARRHRSRSGGLGVCLHRLLYLEKQREQLQAGPYYRCGACWPGLQ
jgi:hypothetical protein